MTIRTFATLSVLPFRTRAWRAVAAPDGAAALRALEDRADLDLVVLDIGLPEIDGLEVCRRIRRESDVPILFLSARSEEIDRVVGFELGGDDYVVKPFSPRELVARVGAIVKRGRIAAAGPARPQDAVAQGPLAIDPAGYRISYGGAELALTASEFTILRALAARPGIVFDRGRIVEIAFAHNTSVSDRTIDSHIRNIRAKFASVGCDDIIQTVHEIGFRLAPMAPERA